MSVDNHAVQKTNRMHEIKAMQLMFVNTIEALMVDNEQIFYCDETSYNCWMRRTKTFSGKKEPIILPYQGERGCNISIIGALNIDTL